VRCPGDLPAVTDAELVCLAVAQVLLPLVEPEVVKLDMHLLRSPHTPGTIQTAAMVSGYAVLTRSGFVNRRQRGKQAKSKKASNPRRREKGQDPGRRPGRRK